MGLDNGFVVKYKNEDEPREVVYWRGFWGLRTDIVDYLRKEKVSEIDSAYRLSNDNIEDIVDIIAEWHDKKTWNGHSGSSRRFKEIKHKLLKDIIILTSLGTEFFYNQDIEYVEFYDSY